MAAIPPKKSWFKSRFGTPALPIGRGQHITDYFQHKAGQQGYTLSDGQQQVIARMAEKVEPLLQPDTVKAPHSLYLHGAVGRGKSWLLDGFFQAMPLSEKRRLHFHDFFAKLHEGMFRHREQPDALALTLDELLADCRVLCFDEFHVHDIGDAMLITRLFKALFERGIFLLVTSNYPPEGLLPNPLYHERFLPVIKLISSQMHVMEVGGAQDYRADPSSGAGQQFARGHYVWPGTPAQRQALQLPPADLPHFPLAVGKRQLRARMSHERSVRFDFDDICEQPTAVMDYLELNRQFDTWIIDKLPLLDDCSIAVQQRFINLIDVLYDQDKCLQLISERPLAESLAGKAIDLARTRSRLGQLIEVGPILPAVPG
ncbi:MAG: cell division protein ZapE [Pseudomonas sp.]|uniref:cell division protein ZapE n=1 Tax=Pseudomonas abieticivorans TaxID=2931382 RepID=UPI0020BFBBA0|nr:cell division protein ZapE [Pseudomonas sp. PIA16]MDE1168055.1 cell division protein ZapE [Pseudomonas sp.]